MSSAVPADMINLRLILVSGKTKEFLFSPNDSAADIAKHVYDNWPMDWEEEQVSSPNILRLIYQGRFLHGNVTLGALKLPFGKTTVMHLVARETLPEPNSQGGISFPPTPPPATWAQTPKCPGFSWIILRGGGRGEGGGDWTGGRNVSTIYE
uniref:Ubiquitin-like protein 3 n=1 Tax=Ornithorhynchus anatinus TaxID=9258 RepID=A0A6I8PIX4_ORNAN